MRSWIPVDDDSDFPLENLPFGAFMRGARSVLGVAIGDRIVDLHATAELGLFDDLCDRALLLAPTLDAFLGAGRPVWRAVRERLHVLLRDDGDARLRDANPSRMFVAQRDVSMIVPMTIGDYVDFYSSLDHATNLGRIFRPDAPPLLPNWRWMPIAYHGRSSTIVIDGTDIVRPCGQRLPAGAAQPVVGPSTRLDIELEVGFVTGPGNRLGTPIAAAHTHEHIFGMLLVNDWSARDIQAWEYQPLGPFLGKSFATTISPWIVTLDALAPFRVPARSQTPEPPAYLRDDRVTYDMHLSVELQTATMRANGDAPAILTRTNLRELYWTIAQQLAHVTINGSVVRAGDLYASGTISGPTPESVGSLIERSWNGTRPIALPNGETRTFLEDGDCVTLRGGCAREGVRRIGFGQARGTIRGR